jgi:RsiW-degrading membrane proteinase PrsW (M82 family)
MTTPDAASGGPAVPLVRRPAFWVYVVAVVAGTAFWIIWFAQVSIDPSTAWVVWIGLVLQAGALLFWGWLILPRRRARAATVLASILIGLSFAPAASALILNLIQMTGANRGIAAGFVEELMKAAAVIIVLFILRSRLRGPLDGLIVGFFVGFGFAVIEDVLYTAGTSSAPEAWLLVFGRLFTQLGGHAMWTSIIGAALAYVIVAGGRRGGLVVGAFGFAMLMHVTWNTAAALAPGLISLLVTVIVAAITIVGFFRVRRWSRDFEVRADSESRVTA